MEIQKIYFQSVEWLLILRVLVFCFDKEKRGKEKENAGSKGIFSLTWWLLSHINIAQCNLSKED